MNKGTASVVLGIVMIGVLFSLMVGCNSENRSDAMGNTETEVHFVPMPFVEVEQEILLDPGPRDAILEAGMNKSNVSGGLAWLESQGYSYVQSNSMVLIETKYAAIGSDPAYSDDGSIGAGKLVPDIIDFKRKLGSDTVMWMAFENPTHDSANHTAIITGWSNDGTPRSILVELDVSQVPPGIIREGEIIGGEFVGGDVGTDTFVRCLQEGALATLGGCLFSNCGYAACLGAGAAATLLVCTFQWANSN